MRRLLLLSFIAAALSSAQVTLQSTSATSKEVTVSYLAPPGYTSTDACGIKASYVNDFTGAYAPVVNVDPAQFPGYETDITHPTRTINGRNRTVVIGEMTPFYKTQAISATSGFRESQAQKAATILYVKITCGVSSVTVPVSTNTNPFGLTFAESHAADPSTPGFYNWPSIKWGINQVVIDPEYGTELKRPDKAGVNGATQASSSFQSVSGASWTNPLNVLADEATPVSATIASSTAALALPWPYALLPLGGLDQFIGDFSGLDWIQLFVKGTSSAATAADGSIQAALSIDGGVTEYTPRHDIDIRSCSAGCSYPTSPAALDHWQATGGRPIPRQWLAKRSGTYTYVNATSTVTIASGDPVGEKWTTGTPFSAFGAVINICAITAGTPVTVTFCTPHGMTTGNSVAISAIDSYGAANPPATCRTTVNGTWVATVVNSTQITLNSSSVASCTYGISFTVDAGTTAGSPPNIFSGNANYPSFVTNAWAKFSGFTDSGWTSLNGNSYAMGSLSYEHFLPTGAVTTGSYTGGASFLMLTGVAQAFNNYPIAAITDATHFTLSSGPGVDITVPSIWEVDPVVVLIRKKTASADTINLQYAKVTTQVSNGTSWGAAGGVICAPGLVAGIGGVLGSLCSMGATPTWIPIDGSASQPFGSVLTQSRAELETGMSCIPGKGVMAINPADLKRIYCSRQTLTSSNIAGTYGQDRNIFTAEYRGDFTPRSSSETAASLLATYPTYGANLGYPYLPNCYGDNKWNDGINPLVITSGGCVAYTLIVPSIQAMIAAADTVEWPKIVTAVSHMPCIGGAGGQANFIYRPSTSTVWMSILCTGNNDQGGIVYVFDLGNERPPATDVTSTVRIAAVIPTWMKPNARWNKAHGGIGLYDGYLEQTAHPMGITPTSNFTIDYNAPDVLSGPYFVDILSVNGVPGAHLTTTLGSCAPFAGNPYLPTTLPGGSGCDTVVVSGEPCDLSPDIESAAVLAANPSFFLSKCGVSGRHWIGDAAVGDIVTVAHDADMTYYHLEATQLIVKTGTTWVLYRGGIKRYVMTDSGLIDHSSDTNRLIMQLSYDVQTAGQGNYFRFYDTGVNLVQKVGLGHGGDGAQLAAGSSGPNYGVLLGDAVARASASTFNFLIPSRGLPFEGKTANDENSTDSHVSYIETASLKNKDPWLLDAAPWQGYTGIAATGPVSGTSHVYTWTNATLSASIYTHQAIKFVPLVARVGMWAIRNISGPGSTIDDSKPYTVCYAYLVNQCRSGSGVGDVFISAPIVDQLTGQKQCCTDNYSKLRDLAISTAAETFSRFTQTLLRNDTTGRTGRAITAGFSTYRGEDPFMNWSGTNDGILGVFRERAMEWVKSELFTATLPPIIEDGVDRTHWWQQSITVRPYPAADNVLVRFGYAHYGDVTAGQLRCTSNYADNCVMGAGTSSSTPYYFETSDTYSGVSISSSPIVVKLPLVPNRVAYWQVVYRTGSTVLYTTPQQVVVSP
jgi:hypothetical protein